MSTHIRIDHSSLTHTPMRYLVTGGAGFIGSNLCEDLLHAGHEVVCLDNFATGRMENIQPFFAWKTFTLIVGDIRNLSDCKNSMDGVDIVLHEAALGSVPRSFADPAATNAVNIDGFLNVLIAARDVRVKRVVYAASSSTYGDSVALPKVEDTIGKPISPYAVTKLVDELYAHVFTLNYGLETIGLRYFNVFGRRQYSNGAYTAVIPKFTLQLMQHTPPVILGDGTTSRDFTYIDNVIQMNRLAASTTNPDAVGQVFNTAAGERTDLTMLVSILKKYLSTYDPDVAHVGICYGPARQGDILHSLASIEKANALLHYEPSHSVESGLKETVEWYWKNLRNGSLSHTDNSHE